MMEDYKTVQIDASAEMIERKSRFIGYCRPVKNQDEAIDFINEIRAMHRQATHNVYAYVLREDNIMRYSDDGEPAGTAGVPVLEVIKKEGLTDICVVVTRYFGGILLGAGGLVRAYGKSAKLGIDAAERVEKIYCKLYLIRCDYSTYGKLEYAINTDGYILKDCAFENDVCMTVGVKPEQENAFLKTVADISGGSAKLSELPGEYITKKV
ncbi:MAG: YigZ family protein [Ruminococcaceae bacterium]|nr:YigZ family protein [Oscillospiraceae bacterium]